MSRRRPDRSGAHPQRRGLLLAESGLRPLRRQGDDGPRAFFDDPDQFDQQRIRLADIDGSGTTDIIYLRPRRRAPLLQPVGQQLERAAATSHQFPRVDDLVVDRARPICSATAPRAWSGRHRCRAMRARPMRYIDLMGGKKPHLLIKTATTSARRRHVHYAPSTKFYLRDKPDGRPWITRLPFPVHVVERVETYDRISRNRFVTRFAYHHGYFDGVEREFRGFGMVEQWDTEEFAALSKRWHAAPCDQCRRGVPCAAGLYQDLVSHRRIPGPRPYLQLLRRADRPARPGEYLP